MFKNLLVLLILVVRLSNDPSISQNLTLSLLQVWLPECIFRVRVGAGVKLNHYSRIRKSPLRPRSRDRRLQLYHTQRHQLPQLLFQLLLRCRQSLDRSQQRLELYRQIPRQFQPLQFKRQLSRLFQRSRPSQREQCSSWTSRCLDIS